MKKTKLFAGFTSVALSVTFALSNPISMLADVDIAKDVTGSQVSTAAVLPVSVDAEAWNYRIYGTWKNLNLQVNDNMYALPKDGSTEEITFHEGDTIKVLAGDSYELYSGTIHIIGDMVSSDGSATDKAWDCYLVCENDALVLKSSDHTSGGGGAHGDASYNYSCDFDFTVQLEDGTPLSGISITDDTAADGAMFSSMKPAPGKVWTWGNGNTYYTDSSYLDSDIATLTCVTDENGYADMLVPMQDPWIIEEFGAYCRINSSVRLELTTSYLNVPKGEYLYLNNGLLDLNTTGMTIQKPDGTSQEVEPMFATLDSLGVQRPASEPKKGDSLFGDYYSVWAARWHSDDSVVVKDSFGNEIGTVTISYNYDGCLDSVISPIDDKHFFFVGGTISPKATLQMADGVTGWSVAGELDTKTDLFHIKLIKTGNLDEEKSDIHTLDLSTGNAAVSSEDFSELLKENESKDIEIKSNNDVTFTFAKGTMQAVDGKDSYDFSTVLTTTYTDDLPSYITKDNFVFRIHFNYSGKLPAGAKIRIPAGTQYTGKTLFYYLMKDDNTFEEVQAVTVDAEGYVTVKQDHCSTYVITTEKLKEQSTEEQKEETTVEEQKEQNTEKNQTSPETGDSMPILVYLLTVVSAIGVVVMSRNYKKIQK